MTNYLNDDIQPNKELPSIREIDCDIRINTAGGEFKIKNIYNGEGSRKYIKVNGDFSIKKSPKEGNKNIIDETKVFIFGKRNDLILEISIDDLLILQENGIIDIKI